ncbi:MAG: pentapeptide repeat-containing protein [Microcoleaceae cyanobacterium]
MKLRVPSLVILGLATLVMPAQAENLAHTQQLLATKQCPNCDLTRVGLVLANLSGANLQGANLAGANLSRADLSGADLSGANLTGASLYGANLMGANLTGTTLSGADLRGAYLGNAIVTDTKVTEAQLTGVIALPGSTGTAEDFYRLGVQEAKAGNYVNAIDHYTQALRLDSDLAAAYFARSMARADLGDLVGAMSDATSAKDLYVKLKSTEGEQISERLVQTLDAKLNPEKEDEPSGGGFLGIIQGVAPLLLRLLF